MVCIFVTSAPASGPPAPARGGPALRRPGAAFRFALGFCRSLPHSRDLNFVALAVHVVLESEVDLNMAPLHLAKREELDDAEPPAYEKHAVRVVFWCVSGLRDENHRVSEHRRHLDVAFAPTF